MKVAVIGSRNIHIIDLKKYLPGGTNEIISGGAKGVDLCAKFYAKQNNIPYTEYLPEYQKYGKAAPLRRNDKIVDAADLVLAFWDGKSKGTKYVIDKCNKIGKPIVVTVNPDDGITVTFDELLERAFFTHSIDEIEKIEKKLYL